MGFPEAPNFINIKILLLSSQLEVPVQVVPGRVPELRPEGLRGLSGSSESVFARFELLRLDKPINAPQAMQPPSTSTSTPMTSPRMSHCFLIPVACGGSGGCGKLFISDLSGCSRASCVLSAANITL